MEICINGMNTEVPQDACILSVLNSQGLVHLQGMAVAVNECVIPRTEWDKYVVQPNDNLLIIHATQGG